MKTNLSRNIFALVLILFTAVGCGKYEDGPWISFRSLEKRIYGTYRVSYISKNNINITSDWVKYYDLDFTIKELSPADISDHIGMEVQGYIDSCGKRKEFFLPLYSLHYWENKDDEMIMMINYIHNPDWYPGRLFYPLIVSENSVPVDSFHITKLSDKELWLYHVNGNDMYTIRFSESN